MIVLDTSVILALFDARDSGHHAAKEWFEERQPRFSTTPLVLAEADHLVLHRGGQSARAALLANVASGAFQALWWDEAGTESVSVAEAYPDVGLTDASLVALAGRLGTTQIATFDERHFRAMTPLQGGGHFTLLPMDE